jgi:hypothetical protein
MVDESDNTTGDRSGLNRRRLLSIGGASVAGFAGLAVASGTAAAWERLEADFKGCGEVWIVVSDDEVGRKPPLTVNVVVDDDGEAVCQTVEITEEAATTVPRQYGDSPVVKHTVGDGKKILAILGNSQPGTPLKCEYIRNDHGCVETPNTADPDDAICVEDAVECN